MRRRPPADAVELLTVLLAGGDARIAAQAYGGTGAPGVAVLMACDLLVPDGVLDAVVCDGCGEPHLVVVARDDTGPGYGWECPEAGFVRANHDDLAALLFSVGHLASTLAATFTDTFGRGRGRVRQLDGTVAWALGVWTIGCRSTTVMLVPGPIGSADHTRTQAALSVLPVTDASMVLLPNSASPFTAAAPFVSIPLDTALQFGDDGRLRLHADQLASALATRAAVLQGESGRPTTEGKVHAVLDALQARRALDEKKTGLSGIVKRTWSEFHGTERCPSDPTLRRHAASWRTRSSRRSKPLTR